MSWSNLIELHWVLVHSYMIRDNKYWIQCDQRVWAFTLQKSYFTGFDHCWPWFITKKARLIQYQENISLLQSQENLGQEPDLVNISPESAGDHSKYRNPFNPFAKIDDETPETWLKRKRLEQRQIQRRIKEACQDFKDLSPERPKTFENFLFLPEKKLAVCLHAKVKQGQTLVNPNFVNKLGENAVQT